MWMYLCLTMGCGIVLAVIVLLASKNGSKSSQLEALKAEIKKQAEEQERAKKTTNTVYSMSADDARRRLHSISNK